MESNSWIQCTCSTCIVTFRWWTWIMNAHECNKQQELSEDSEWDWSFNVTCNDISVIYVTAHRCAGGLKKKLDLRSGSQRYRHFVRFFNVPVQAPTRGHHFYGYSEKLPYLVAFYDTLGIPRTYSHLKPPGSPWGDNKVRWRQPSISVCEK